MCVQLSNSSLLDEATAAAEAMTMCSALARGKKDKFLVSVCPPPHLPTPSLGHRSWAVDEVPVCVAMTLDALPCSVSLS